MLPHLKHRMKAFICSKLALEPPVFQQQTNSELNFLTFYKREEQVYILINIPKLPLREKQMKLFDLLKFL